VKGTNISASPVNWSDGAPGLIGSDQSGNSTQVDRESSYRGGIRRHSAQWSTCAEHHPNNGPLHPEVAGGRNM
jgi:hypothetical protein